MKNLNTFPHQLLTVCLMLILFSQTKAQEPVTYEPAFPNLSFEFPVEIQNAGDNSNRLFVVEQPGIIKVFANDENATTAQVFLDIEDIVSFSSGQEIGLLGLAFHPDFENNGYFYVYHTRNSSVPNVNVELVLARYQVSQTNPDQANPSSRLDIFSFDKNQSNSNHNGGKIAFGPDGYLYASLGDGGGAGDPRGNAQNLNNVFGKIFRIDVDIDGNNPIENNPDLPDGNYEIPSDNPLIGADGLDELFAWGIRNTWKFSFHPQTNQIWGGDVGQNSREEINIISKGGNYGWNRFEGNLIFDSGTTLATTPDIKPIFTYDRNNGDVSITGGYIYQGTSTNEKIKDKYIYGDYVSGRVWALDYNPENDEAVSELLFRTDGEFISSFGLDESGELYFSGYGQSAQLFKIIGGDNPEPDEISVDGIGNWSALAEGTNGVTDAVVSQNENIIVSGEFDQAGSISVNNIAQYSDQSGWDSLNGGSNGRISTLAVDSEGKIYAGGNFTTIGGINANNIAVWDGNSWSPLGTGVQGTVNKIGIDAEDNIYVGGSFETAGNIIVNNIALWNGNWQAIADSDTGTIGTNNEIRAIAFASDNTLYVGGNFDSAGGKTANRIATFDGTTWGTLGEGTSGFVQAIAISEDFIYTGGNFAIAGGQTVNRIARWNRSSEEWQAISGGVSGNVNTLALSGGFLYVGGSFETATTQNNEAYIVKNIARWNEEKDWEALGPQKTVGTDNPVNSLEFFENKLIVGGSFTNAGNVEALNVATWVSGSVLREYWTGISGDRISDLTTSANYPEFPTGTDQLFQLEATDWNNTEDNNTWADGYGQRIRGYITPSETGSYTFWIAGDNDSEFYISTSDNPDEITRIASVRGWTGLREWDKFASQKSNDIVLESGQPYYIEILHKEGFGGDRVSVGWSTPGQAKDQPSEIVPGTVLSPFIVENSVRIADGAIYELQPQHDIELRLDVRGNSDANSTVVDGYPQHGKSNQQWKFISLGDDLYEIEPQNAIGKRLDVDGASTSQNTEIHIYQRHGRNNQIWKALAIGNNLYSFQPQNATENRLDIENIDGKPRALSRKSDGDDSQIWRLIPVDNERQFEENEYSIKAYPNPFTSQINVQNLSINAGTMTISNITGRVVQNVVIAKDNPGEINLQTSHWAPGIYFLTYTSSTKVSVIKVVKK